MFHVVTTRVFYSVVQHSTAVTVEVLCSAVQFCQASAALSLFPVCIGGARTHDMHA